MSAIPVTLSMQNNQENMTHNEANQQNQLKTITDIRITREGP